MMMPSIITINEGLCHLSWRCFGPQEHDGDNDDDEYNDNDGEAHGSWGMLK